MNMTLPFWTLPLAITLLFVGLAIHKLPASSGPYDIGSAFEGLVKLCAAIIGSLLVWIAYLLVVVNT